MITLDRQSDDSGWRILIAGTGGQGVLTAARLLCDVLVVGGHRAVSGQLHGMAQRGGSVQSSLIIDGGISPVIPSGQADFVLGLEPVETARALPLMSARTVVYMNMAPVVPYVLAQRFVLQQERAEGGLCINVRGPADAFFPARGRWEQGRSPLAGSCPPRALALSVAL